MAHRVEKTSDANKAGKIEGTAIEVFQPALEQRAKAQLHHNQRRSRKSLPKRKPRSRALESQALKSC